MLKKTIEFEDLEGNPVSEDFYFNLNKAELLEMEYSRKGGLPVYLQRIVASNDNKEIVALFKEIVMMSVGRKSVDGRTFIKNDEIRQNFEQSNAYSELFVELISDESAGAAFINGVVPKDVAQQIAEQANKPVEDVKPAPWIEEGREPTPEEVKTMTPEQLAEAYRLRLSRDKN